MLQWKPEHLYAFVNERSPRRLFDIAVHLARDLGMEYLGLNLRIQIATQTPRRYLYSNYPNEWIECCQRDDFYKLDPAANVSHSSTMPVLWTEELYREAPLFRQAACQHGLRHGWTQSLHDLQHNESQISVARPKGKIDIVELYDKAGNVQWLCHTLHAVLGEYHLSALCPAAENERAGTGSAEMVGRRQDCRRRGLHPVTVAKHGEFPHPQRHHQDQRRQQGRRHRHRRSAWLDLTGKPATLGKAL